MNSKPIVILGFMGSGKSTVSRALARRLKIRAVDLDDEIIRAEGRSPARIFAEDGEPSFREIETRVLREILRDDQRRVIALGGGAWTNKKNRELIKASEGTSIWLDAPFELCWQRILASSEVRPLAPSEQETRDLYTKRRASYESAELYVDAAAHKSANEIAVEITRALAMRKI